MKMALFGGSFSPPHLGHIDCIRQLLKEFDRVVVSPAAAHAFGKALPDYWMRVSWLNALIMQRIEPADRSRVIVSHIEQSILWERQQYGLPAVVYTYDVLSYLRNYYRPDQLKCAIGGDIAKDEVWRRYYRAADIDRDFGRYVLNEVPEVRSTLCRKMIEEGRFDALSTLTGNLVAGMIQKNNPYPMQSSKSKEKKVPA